MTTVFAETYYEFWKLNTIHATVELNEIYGEPQEKITYHYTDYRQ